MASPKRCEGESPHHEQPAPIEITVPPELAEQVGFTRTPDGGYTIFLHGEIKITVQKPTSEASESPVTDAETPSSGLIPESTASPVTDRHSAGEKPSWTRVLTEGEVLPESENEKFQLVGNPARKVAYRVTRKSNTRIADFVLATHPDTETTEYWRIRAFGDQAEKVRDQVAVGQKGVEATVYGPKYWKGRKKTADGYVDTVVKGYHAGFVRVSQQYRPDQFAEKQVPQEKN